MKELYKKKAFAYMTREHEGQTEVLIRTKVVDGREQGREVLGGVVQQDETLEQALLRIVQQEAGLQHVVFDRLVAEELVHVKEAGEYQKRHFYHVLLTEATESSWQHNIQPNTRFSYKWVNIEKCPVLLERQAAYLHLVEKQYLR